VRLEEPGWWYGEGACPRLLAPFLAPLAHLYSAIAQARFRRQPYRSLLPVICAGNFAAGGTGKTPLAIFIARLLIERGDAPAFLTRGYGGRERGPVWVEEGEGAAERFGDEPLLLARIAPTLVARDRAAGAQMIEASGRKLSAIVMDDGLQNAGLAKDLALAVVDGERGLGNGEVIPAGPLRAPIDFQLGLVDAIVVREAEPAPTEAADGIHEQLRRRFPGPVLAAHTQPQADATWLAGAPVVAFAGIANPQRFFALLERLGARLLARVAFPDHHVLSRADADDLKSLAEEKSAQLVTTEKDWVRLKGGESFAQALAERARPLAIELVFEARDAKRLTGLIDAALRRENRAARAVRPA
jgi:tetraacyldisaccharide 4'-kinase